MCVVDEDYIRRQFRNVDESTDQSMRGLRWDNAQVRQVSSLLTQGNLSQYVVCFLFHSF